MPWGDEEGGIEIVRVDTSALKWLAAGLVNGGDVGGASASDAGSAFSVSQGGGGVSSLKRDWESDRGVGVVGRGLGILRAASSRRFTASSSSSLRAAACRSACIFFFIAKSSANLDMLTVLGALAAANTLAGALGNGVGSVYCGRAGDVLGSVTITRVAGGGVTVA